MPSQKRLNININRQTEDGLHEVATAEGITITETVRRLVGVGLLIRRAQRAGKTIQFNDGSSTETVRFEF